MTKRQSLIGRIADLPWLQNRARNMLVLAITLIGCGVLSLYGRPYRAVAVVTPIDLRPLVLNPATGRLGPLPQVFDNEVAVATVFHVATSEPVARRAAMALQQTGGPQRRIAAATKWLSGRIMVRVLRGGAMEVAIVDHDPKRARDAVEAVIAAIDAQVAATGRRQIRERHAMLIRLTGEAQARVAAAAAAQQAAAGNARLAAQRRAELAAATAIVASYADVARAMAQDDISGVTTLRILQPAHIAAQRPLNRAPALIGGLLLLLAMAIGAYRVRPGVRDSVRHDTRPDASGAPM